MIAHGWEMGDLTLMRLVGAGHDAAGIEVFAGEEFDVIHKGRVAVARSVLR